MKTLYHFLEMKGLEGRHARRRVKLRIRSFRVSKRFSCHFNKFMPFRVSFRQKALSSYSTNKYYLGNLLGVQILDYIMLTFQTQASLRCHFGNFRRASRLVFNRSPPHEIKLFGLIYLMLITGVHHDVIVKTRTKTAMVRNRSKV